ncbi:MAG TPA: hypothetical protein VGO01_10795 [Bradyrhizobium sp.]|nr:hypothetical protein [Bradyrhizobium sp.]
MTKVATEIRAPHRSGSDRARVLAQDVIATQGNRQGLVCIFLNKKVFRPDAVPAFSREAGVALRKAVPASAAIVKICRSFVSGFQKNPARGHGVQQKVGEQP